MTDDPLREEHEALQRAVQASRRAFEASPDSSFVKAMREAMDDYHKIRAEGVTREDAVKGIEAVLRANWPKAPSRFPAACELCHDTGWQEHHCWHEQRCGRELCGMAHPSHEHDYVSPCGCSKGDRHRPRPTTFDDDMNALGRPKKKAKKGFTRF